MTAPAHRLAVVLGSNRRPRLCDIVAAWACAEVVRHGDFRIDRIDPLALGLPQALPHTPDPPTRELRRRLALADAVLVITPEYNHGYPAPLKQIIDAARRFDAQGLPRDHASCQRAMQAMLAQLHWWSVTLRAGRAARPYAAHVA